MAELKILGVKRVEALQSILDDKYTTKIAELVVPSHKEVEGRVDGEFGITDLRQTYKDARTAAEAALEKLNEVTGENVSLSISSGYGRSKATAYSKRVAEISSQNDESSKRLKAECSAKKRQLWLCETLEDAKAIVEGA